MNKFQKDGIEDLNFLIQEKIQIFVKDYIIITTN